MNTIIRRKCWQRKKLKRKGKNTHYSKNDRKWSSEYTQSSNVDLEWKTGYWSAVKRYVPKLPHRNSQVQAMIMILSLVIRTRLPHFSRYVWIPVWFTVKLLINPTKTDRQHTAWHGGRQMQTYKKPAQLLSDYTTLPISRFIILGQSYCTQYDRLLELSLLEVVRL